MSTEIDMQGAFSRNLLNLSLKLKYQPTPSEARICYILWIYLSGTLHLEYIHTRWKFLSEEKSGPLNMSIMSWLWLVSLFCISCFLGSWIFSVMVLVLLVLRQHTHKKQTETPVHDTAIVWRHIEAVSTPCIGESKTKSGKNKMKNNF